jgi:hypothetical protein
LAGQNCIRGGVAAPKERRSKEQNSLNAPKRVLGSSVIEQLSLQKKLEE